jgi:type 1 glutamine amidotransferase
MKFATRLLLPVALLGAVFLLVNAAEAPKPLRVLLVAGGCCHEYDKQSMALKEAIEARLHAVVDVAYNPDKSTKAVFDIYKSSEWAKGFDVVIHDECSADVTDKAYVENILAAHRNGTPAVNLHCAMHSYRWGEFRKPVKAGDDNAGWFEMLGLQSTGHGPQEPIDIIFTDKEHPITKGMDNWMTIKEELYNNIQVLTGKPLATGKQMVKPKAKKGEPPPAEDAPAKEENAVIVWTNEYGEKKTRIFSTTIGHNTETVKDPRYIDLVTRGLLWVTGKLGDDGKVTEGYAK